MQPLDELSRQAIIALERAKERSKQPPSLDEIGKRLHANLPPPSTPPKSPASNRFYTAAAVGQSLPDACPVCAGAGWYLAVSDAHPEGRLLRCGTCVNLLKFSRLNHQERGHALTDITDLASDGSHTVLRYLGQELLSDPYGWLVLWGSYGAAKSLLLTALVAEFCRRGVRAVYYHGKDLEQGLFQDMHGDSANRQLYRKVDVLAIDEMHTVNVRSDWVAAELGALLEERYRNQATRVTVMAMNPNPKDWCHIGDSAWGQIGQAIWSRMNDGRFVRPWPEDRQIPACLDGEPRIPAVFCVNGPDVRPALRRQLVQDPPHVPHMGKIKAPPARAGQPIDPRKE